MPRARGGILIGCLFAGAGVTVEGFGARRPIASNATDDGRQQNRRVEILVTPRP